MAELLVCASDGPVRDHPGRWLAGMVVAVMEDGHQWGRKEGPPKFQVVRVPGSASDYAHLMQPRGTEEQVTRRRDLRLSPEIVEEVKVERIGTEIVQVERTRLDAAVVESPVIAREVR